MAERALARGEPFIFSTGYSVATCEGYRDRPVLKKPFTYEELSRS